MFLSCQRRVEQNNKRTAYVNQIRAAFSPQRHLTKNAQFSTY